MKLKKSMSNSKKTENLIKLFLITAKDIKTVLTKLADRYHKMQTLGVLTEKEQKKIAQETLEIYAPIANRLGMGELKSRLEDLAFKYLYPEEHQRLEKEVTKRYKTCEQYIKELEPILCEVLKKANIIPLEINTRTKYLYSLYKKLLRHQMNFDAIHDLVAARIIVKNINDCYLALGAIHQIWKPIPGLIKDYIAMPKPNGYQSLHTSVFGPEGKITEIQIRTPKMHAQAENGIASHWAYKEKKINAKEIAWIEQLREWQKTAKNPDEFFESFKIDLFEDRIFVLTPQGDAIDMPAGATPVDFAYQIHTTVGNECTGVKINGKIAALNTKLKSGDLVEIFTQKGKKPSVDWLNFVKTSQAKDKIRSVLKEKTKKLRFKT